LASSAHHSIIILEKQTNEQTNLHGVTLSWQSLVTVALPVFFVLVLTVLIFSHKEPSRDWMGGLFLGCGV
jgi:hypothetical protein